MKHWLSSFLCVPVLFASGLVCARAQAPAPSQSDERGARTAQMEKELSGLSAELTQTQEQLQRAQQQIKELQQELIAMRGGSDNSADNLQTSTEENAPASVDALSAAVTYIEEQQEVLEAEVAQHDQTKLETASKYRVRVTGLVLFNAFRNHGGVDDIDEPSYALPVAAGQSSLSTGAGFRQTILGLQGVGPRFMGARTSANLSVDFFGGLAYATYGTSAGTVRMRTADVDLDWDNNSLQFGLVTPLISPRSPDSYAAVAEPAMAAAGNLWAWAPQIAFRSRLPLHGDQNFAVELGLLDTPAAVYNTATVVRTPSPGELSGQPAYESRLSWSNRHEEASEFAVSGYFGRQSYPNNDDVNSWAATADWQQPFGSHIELTGEAYRGLALGGLGGGVYKDFVPGDNPISGAFEYHPLNAAGGWAQLKANIRSGFEANAAFGEDDGFAADFHAVVLSPTATAAQLRARNTMVSANLIYRPKTYFILSPEYRRIWTWQITGLPSTAGILTLSAGYEF
jgi:Skp family chaperone for outer membrane proteins